MPGVTLKDVESHAFVKAYAAHLKKSGKVELPKYLDLVKTAVGRELPPYDPDWYYVRLAAIARRLYLHQGLGVGALRVQFGGKKRRGAKPPHAHLASGSVIRSAVQQLEKLKVVEKDAEGGRRISQTGQRDIDRIASQVATAAKK
ncbi:ribosomal protein S19 [Capsaspora owczarzaki ATCC 30864]|uniref:Ribosomal protein S19 n=1 Tax=Capsaspora owczarzaki (strain ATCC 30864) TaxID=595528 RepID=A0A0D2WLX3_CAPO3|nr:ribosomal protein S19 [Capsaspora owczarzaki ATCC 30864]KJE91018.1 ribosomal protein S19 [Capsaspora owczarzaki ATCC 30864]|eukprot:XP_004348972.1 ribosomal protein S19 [Capsaspora owczarzaki ATCC 30864]